MRSYAAAADDYHEGFSQLCEAVVCQEDAVSSELFEDEICSSFSISSIKSSNRIMLDTLIVVA